MDTTRQVFVPLRRPTLSEQGLCEACELPKGKGRARAEYCFTCELQYGGHDVAQMGQSRKWARRIRCADCRKWFESPDRRKVTTCPRCQGSRFSAAKRVTEEALMDTGYEGITTVYEKLKLVSGKMTRENEKRYWKQLNRLNDEQAVFRRLTEQELARYTPEYGAEVLRKANANFQANRLVPFTQI